MTTVPVVLAPDHEGHHPDVEVQCGRPIPAFDTPARMESVLAALRGTAWARQVEPTPRGDVDAAMARVHDTDLLDFLRRAWDEAPRETDDGGLLFADTFWHQGLQTPAAVRPVDVTEGGAMGRYCFDTITGVGPGTWRAARGSVLTALTAADAVLAGDRLAVGLCRPPGHHVTRSVFGGGCYLNNAAITAQSLRDRGVATVLVVDVDFHHGNGTQALFHDRADVVYTSLHGDPRRSYPYFTGHAEERGSGDGSGATINVPLPPGVEGAQYLDLLQDALQRSAAHAPEAVVVSLGFDTFRGDVSGDALLDTPDYARIGEAVAGLGLPLVVLLEGGYSVPALGENLVAWLDGARGVHER
ncbi:histone deacetylase family protein [Kineococcus sp. DHX-1]|uniref:histone deacetylase family protein n=1 Tax=Kineococcus sp. DHX-1 TaxID=3349638 RepID=UPI0036D245A0